MIQALHKTNINLILLQYYYNFIDYVLSRSQVTLTTEVQSEVSIVPVKVYRATTGFACHTGIAPKQAYNQSSL